MKTFNGTNLLTLVAVFAAGFLAGVNYVGWSQKSNSTYLDLIAPLSLFELKPSENVCSIPPSTSKTETEKRTLLTRVSKFMGWKKEERLSGDLVKSTTSSPLVQTSQSKHKIVLEDYRYAWTSVATLSSSQTTIVRELAKRSHSTIENLHTRSAKVPFGGPNSGGTWWHPTKDSKAGKTDLEKLDGGHLIFTYEKIMNWPQDLFSKFPHRKCPEGCNNEIALAHSLEWREKYKPWLITPTAMAENQKGFVYHHGFSPAPPQSKDSFGKHSILWLRMSPITRSGDDLSFWRAILNCADRAIAASLKQSNQQVGKFNVVVDGEGFALGKAPSLQSLKQGVTMLQDHYPNRLGMVLITNLSTAADLFCKVLFPLLTKDVRLKIKILPKDPSKRMAILSTVVEDEFIPDWLGGNDTHRFDLDTYYPKELQFSDEDGRAFLTSMPYHQK